MRVIFNTLATLKTKTGVGHYAAQVARVVGTQLSAGEFDVFPHARWHPLCRRLAADGTQGRGGQQSNSIRWLKAQLKSAGRFAIDRYFAALCRRGNYSLYHEPNFLPLQCDVPTVITIHDLSVVRHPEWHPTDRVERHQKLFRTAVSRAAHVITVSETVRQEVIAELNVPAHRVTAVHNGVGDEFFQSSHPCSIPMPNRYLLYVGTIEPRKNLMTLLRAYCDLPGSLRETCSLVIAGGWGWKSDDVAEYMRTTAAPRNVVHLGYVADTDRPGLYAGARALLFPSHYEGFGLPPLEMLASGGAVIASDTSAHREVLSRHAHFISANDVGGWRDAVSRAIVDDDWIGQLRRGGKSRAATFSWERCGRETVAVYRQLNSRLNAAA